MNYIITDSQYPITNLHEQDLEAIVLSVEELEHSEIRFGSADKVYVPSETSLSAVMLRMDDSKQVDGINKLKDKFLCREALKTLYPDFYYAKHQFADLAHLNIGEKPLVIKPMRGFFGTGVRIADSQTDMMALSKEISREIAGNSRFFSETIITKDDFIIEEFIDGEEYAVDMFYNEQGNPHLVNIYHHPQPQISDYSHLMYYSNRELFTKHLSTFTAIFDALGKVLQLKNFPIHAEFKSTKDGFIPIEFNPMRYGGFGLADLAYHSYGFRSIAAYFQGRTIDWNEVWSGRLQDNYAFIIAYNPKLPNLEEYAPNHDRFKDYLQQHADLLSYLELDYLKFPVFAIAYVQSSTLSNLMKLLSTDFTDFFDKKTRN